MVYLSARNSTAEPTPDHTRVSSTALSWVTNCPAMSYGATTEIYTARYTLSLHDALPIYCIGGIVGALGTAIVADPALGGQGWFDYTVFPAGVGEYDMAGQFLTQLKAVLLTLAWSGIGSAVLFLALKYTIGLRPTEEAEREGLDLSEHGERAYNY